MDGSKQVPGTACGVLRTPGDVSANSFARGKKLLVLSQEVQGVIEERGWSWCDLRQVYRILEQIYG